MTKTVVGKSIRERRLAQGWSQEELAHRAGLSQTVVSRAERNAKVSRMALVMISEVLDAGSDVKG